MHVFNRGWCNIVIMIPSGAGGGGGGGGGRGLLSRMAYMGRIRLKGDPFSGFRYAK